MRADMPPNEYYELFKPDHSLFIPKDDAMRNDNSRQRLDQVRRYTLLVLRIRSRALFCLSLCSSKYVLENTRQRLDQVR
jgi:hypothetical protein